MVIIAKSRDGLSIDHKKCLRDFFPRHDSIKRRLELLFLLAFVVFSETKDIE